MGHRSTCERARLSASLRPDGALSEIEQRLLDSHLAQCSDCRFFAQTVTAVTTELRAASLETAHFSVTVPRAAQRRRLQLSALTTATGAAAALVALAVFPFFDLADRPTPMERPAIVIDATSVEGAVEYREFLSDLRDYQNAQHARESELAVDRNFGTDAR